MYIAKPKATAKKMRSMTGMRRTESRWSDIACSLKTREGWKRVAGETRNKGRHAGDGGTHER